MEIAPSPSAFRRLLQRVEDDPAGNIPGEGLAAACDKALGGFERAAGQAVSRIRGVVDARRGVEAGEWSDAAVGRIRLVLHRLEDARKVLDGDSLPNGAVAAVREDLKALDEERQSTDRLAAAAREVLARLEACDLPLPVLTRSLDEIRTVQTAGREAAAALLERLRVVLDLPWTARACERVDIGAAMAELEAAHAAARRSRKVPVASVSSRCATGAGNRPGTVRCRASRTSYPAATARRGATE